jgi:multidrug efflux system membrane fusion protein
MNTQNNTKIASSSANTAKVLAITIVLIAVATSGFWYWKSLMVGQPSWSAGAPIDVVTVKLQSQNITQTLSSIGEVRAINQVTLSSEVSGQIKYLNIDSGESVSKGAVLVQLDDQIEQADLVSAKASAQFASQQLKRAENLVKTGATSTEVLQQRKAESDQANAHVMQLSARISKKNIKAPFDGVIGIRQVDLGQYLNPGDAVATLTDSSRLYINFDVPQQSLWRISKGQNVTVSTDIPEFKNKLAIINAIEPQLNPSTRNVRVQATLVNDDYQLSPGMFVNVKIMLTSIPESIVVPTTAIMTSPFGNTAVVVRDLSPDNIGTAQIIPIVVGAREGDTAIISDGLQPGDVLITEGQLRVRPGSQVHVLNKDSE